MQNLHAGIENVAGKTVDCVILTLRFVMSMNIDATLAPRSFCAMTRINMRLQARRGMRKGSINCTGKDTSRGTCNVSCTAVTGSPNSAAPISERT